MTTIYRDGRIFTAVPGAPFAEALVVDGARIVFAGPLEEARATAGRGAREVDLAGRMLMPGLHDAHTHLLAAGMKYRHEVRLPAFAPPGQVVDELVAARPPGHVCGGHDAWVVGGEVFSADDDPGRLTRRQLDEQYPDTPLFLYDYSIHHGVANSEALRRAGVDEGDEYGHGGRYRRDADGVMTGELIEEATWKVLRAVPEPGADVYRDAVEWAVGMCHRYGITSVQEASASRQALEAYQELDRQGRLRLRVAAHLVWRNEGFGMASAEALDRLLDDPGRWSTDLVDTRFVKVWMDGAPLPPVPTHAPISADGEVEDEWLLVQEQELFDVVRRFDADGRTVKVHCAGAGAVRVALDAVERVRAVNGPGRPHEIAHAGFVSEPDYRRIAELDMTAEMSPALWHVPEYGLSEGFWFSRMIDEGVRMTIGSDWIITPDPNLFPGVQGAVQHATHPVPLETALAAVTRVGAQAVGRGSERGTLEAGKAADYIVLDRDLFTVPEDRIGEAVVTETYVAGELVHAVTGAET
ncbi:amidohydrolase [Isoptericola sp. BMS4]|uniref:amidohydrolase n=1 Tax=Isoptericola sp. BMS4 TaxID=2527875 RepID=UPI00141F44D1|nr:amidohydrolase [Isoptericola sp. BMS4]